MSTATQEPAARWEQVQERAAAIEPQDDGRLLRAGRRKDAEVQAILGLDARYAATVWRPVGIDRLRTRRLIGEGCSLASPFLRRLRRLPAQVANGRLRVSSAAGDSIVMPPQDWESPRATAGGQRTMGFNLAGFPGTPLVPKPYSGNDLIEAVALACGRQPAAEV